MELLQKLGVDMSRLAKRMEAIAAALEASAVAYRRNENANVALFRRAEGPW
jgi:post-segregation antitoxin (ccd killing protein)